jgi:hypothetical protein
MIYTVFVSADDIEEQREAELLEYAWQRCGQAGELIRLMPSPPGARLPNHSLARAEKTLSWTKHPYIQDSYPGYNLPAALLEWLQRDSIDATILLLESGSILRQAINQEVESGDSVGHAWKTMPTGDGPFALSAKYARLKAWCVNRDLELPRVQVPLLIHSSDLLKICPRWLELTGLIRTIPDIDTAPPGHPLKLALAIAAAEYRLAIREEDLTSNVLEAEDGGQNYLDFYEAYKAARANGDQLRSLLPRRRHGVRQACVLDQWYLELGSTAGLVSLNVSAGAIWQLCDGQRTLMDIVETLQATYGIPLNTMMADVTEAAKILRYQGAINLENVA